MRIEEENSKGRREKNEEVRKKRVRQESWERREEKRKGNIFKRDVERVGMQVGKRGGDKRAPQE